ncbi:MAG: M48 family metallopeptidase [Candidatus Scalindua sp.]|nr:M48 family metallopeptidase [Candidatus Scalindua sp.]
MKISRGCISLIIVILFLSLSCTTVPITGRQQFSILPNSAMISMSLQQYNEFLKNNKISSNQEQTQMVKKVGRKIQMAVEQYFTDKNMSYALKDYKWEFNLIESEEKNAWAMPGGKVVVYEGILPITKNEAGLAVVMGHEIAHAIAKHGNERMSQGLIAQMGGMALSKALAEKPEKTEQLWMTVFGVGAQFGVMLPFSRLQETEADHLGLIFMAIAGYDPDEAVEVWKRMAQMKEGQTPPKFLSTHPSNETRIRKIKETIPKAKQYL